jgi:hypothetical protein
MRTATIAGSINLFSIVDQPVLDQSAGERVVLFPTGDQFGDDAVVRVQCVAASGMRAGGFDQHQTITPSAGQGRGRDADALGVVAVHLVERRQLADCSVDAVGLAVVRVVEESHVDFHGGRRFPREAVLRDGCQDRLPITTTSGSSAIWLAARRTCSRCSRLTPPAPSRCA